MTQERSLEIGDKVEVQPGIMGEVVECPTCINMPMGDTPCGTCEGDGTMIEVPEEFKDNAAARSGCACGGNCSCQ